MMVARLGDSHSHGGKIITGSTTKLTDGKPTARLSDAVTCPVHGNNSIVSVPQSDNITDGKPTATVGSLTACNATIITGSEDVQIG